MANIETSTLPIITESDPAADYLIIIDTSDDPDALKRIAPENAGVASTFTSLSDAPPSFSGHSLKIVRVNSGETALEFFALTESFVIAVSDETTPITTGATKLTFRMPYALTLTEVRASLTTASSSGTPTIDINEGGSSILSTVITIDVGEKTSTTAATPPVISDTALANDAEITIDIDVAGTGATGLKVYLIGKRV